MISTIKDSFTGDELDVLWLLPSEDLLSIRHQCKRAMYLAAKTGKAKVVTFNVDEVTGTSASIIDVATGTPSGSVVYHDPEILMRAVNGQK